MNNRQWAVYLIRCSDESLYCGITNNLKNRLAMHNSGRGAKYTRSRRPVELVATSSEMTKGNALKLEYRVKRVSASEKHYELTKGEDKMAMNLKKELQSVKKNLETLSKKLEKMVAAASAPEKAKPKVVKAKPAKKAATKKTSVKKQVKKASAETVMAVIQNSSGDVSIETLKEKTGFLGQKLYNTLSNLKKRGKIKNPSKGIYVKA